MKKMPTHADAVVVGAGIAGLAMAYHLSRMGQKVVLIERNEKASGASIRNFGLVWPIGQPQGELRELAMFGRAHWLTIAKAANIWAIENGSLHLAHHDDELAVLEEFRDREQGSGYTCEILSPDDVVKKSPAVKATGLKAGLSSSSELTVNPRQAIRTIPAYLEEQLNVHCQFNTTVLNVDHPRVITTNGILEADQVYICSGTDFETMYPEIFAASDLVKVKLQMMRTDPQEGGWRIGPSLCAGLTLQHYESFADCPSLPRLKKRLAQDYPEHLKWGIHVLLSQNDLGHLIIGDSHEYGPHHDPFDREDINSLINQYLASFARAPSLNITERWHGIYSKSPSSTYFLSRPEEGVTVLTGFSGAGMTLSFGVTEKIVRDTTYSMQP